jgi:hypothetical protein
MNIDDLMLASAPITSRNVDEHVLAAAVQWNADLSDFTLTYYLDRRPTEDDKQQCDLALAEIIAEFSEINRASAVCIHLQKENSVGELAGVVYQRATGSCPRSSGG